MNLKSAALRTSWLLAGKNNNGCHWHGCDRPGREKFESLLPGDDGMWRYRFCSRKHLNQWYTEFLESNFGI